MSAPARTSRTAFTLVELLIVVSIIVVAMAAVLPAFRRITESNNYSGAVNAVSATLARASAAGKDGGVVFLFDPQTRRATLQLVEIYNADATLAPAGGSSPRVPAVAFRPVPGVQPVDLPVGIGIYGLSYAHDDYTPRNQQYGQIPDYAHWYDREVVYSASAQADGRMSVNSWLFPRNHPQFFLPKYNPDLPNDNNAPNNNNNTRSGVNNNYLLYSQSFMVRFNARGEAIGSGALIGAVRDAYLEFPGLPEGDVDSNITWNSTERDDQFDPDVYYNGSALFRPVYNPEVHLRPVDQLAIVDLDALKAAAGAPEPWFVRSSAGNVAPPPVSPGRNGPTYWVNPDDQNGVLWKINRWIDENAQVIGFGRYSGQVVKR